MDSKTYTISKYLDEHRYGKVYSGIGWFFWLVDVQFQQDIFWGVFINNIPMQSIL
ncbi:hypothetical protein [Epilithonimonas hominis]|uniref:hypothetical protein n=1 Tax=Epilithonimonas hominis TaxID=420404 RepID=UPI0015A601F1|nr:hypothetical protein [Epilithonimonas hominis]